MSIVDKGLGSGTEGACGEAGLVGKGRLGSQRPPEGLGGSVG